MPNREIASDLIVADSIGAGNKSGTLNGATVDVSRADAAMIVVSYGTNVDAGATISIEHGDEQNGSDAVALVPSEVVDNDVLLYGEAYAVPVASAAIKYSYVGAKKYVRVILGGTVTDTDFHAQVILGKLLNAPAV